MLQTARQPRFLGLLIVVLVVVAAFGQLGRWQLDVAQGKAREEALAAARSQAPVPLETVLQPHTQFPGELSTRPVTVVGEYAASGQVLVPNRRLEGETGYWVITPFVVRANGANLPVLRGFVTAADEAGTPPSGEQTLGGGLAPSESPSSVPVGDGEVGSVDTSLLVNTWNGDIYNAFLFLQEEAPGGGQTITRVPTPLGDIGVSWRNAAYAVQWWIFAAFAVWMWVRVVREEALSQADDETSLAEGDNG